MRTKLCIIVLSLIASSLRVAAEPPPDAAAYAREIVASHGGAEKLLRIVKFSEMYFLNGDTTKGTDRTSILQPPRLWFVGKTERVEEDNKGIVCRDVWMWTLAPLVHVSV